MENPLLTSEESRLHDLARSRAKKYLECESQLLEVIEEIDRKRVFEKVGARSTFAYCTGHLKLSEATAYNFINVCRKSREVPELKIAINEGRLSVPKARKIVAVLTAQNQAEWIEKAATLPQAQLERCVADAAPSQLVRERAKPCGPQLVKVELALTVAEFEAFERARDILSQKIGCAATAQQTLAAQTEQYLEKHDPVRRAARWERRKIKREGVAKAPLIACDAGGVGAMKSGVRKERKGSSGRSLSREQQSKRQALPAAVKHAVDLRDGRKCQSCGSTRWVHYHHLRPLAAGGSDTPENLLTLCSSCHRREHPPYRAA